MYIFSASPVFAQSASPPAPAISPAAQLLSSRLFADLTLERHLEFWRNEFRQADADKNGVVDADDIEIHAKAGGAMLRVSYLALIMRADLDGDGAVTEDEFRRFWRYNERLNALSRPADPQAEGPVEAEVRKIKAMDADGDGRVTTAEVMKFAMARSWNTPGKSRS